MKSLFLFIIFSLLTACSTPPTNTITQVATLEGLLAGVYDGEITLGEISRNGDFGLGTYQGLDGEMVLLDGTFYQIKVDGTVHQPPSDTLSPFAAAVNFVPNVSAVLPPLDLDGLKEYLDKQIPNQNLFVAIRIDGHFSEIRTRSVARQSKPYRPLSEVVKTQAVFDLKDVEGTLIGFRCPPYVEGLNVPGYHFHFLSKGLDAGGHVLALQMTKGKLLADTEHDAFVVALPQSTTYSRKGNLPTDSSRALEAEQQDKK